MEGESDCSDQVMRSYRSRMYIYRNIHSSIVYVHIIIYHGVLTVLLGIDDPTQWRQQNSRLNLSVTGGDPTVHRNHWEATNWLHSADPAQTKPETRTLLGSISFRLDMLSVYVAPKRTILYSPRHIVLLWRAFYSDEPRWYEEVVYCVCLSVVRPPNLSLSFSFKNKQKRRHLGRKTKTLL